MMKPVLRWIKITLVCSLIVMGMFSLVGYAEHADIFSTSSFFDVVRGSAAPAYASEASDPEFTGPGAYDGEPGDGVEAVAPEEPFGEGSGNEEPPVASASAPITTGNYTVNTTTPGQAGNAPASEPAPPAAPAPVATPEPTPKPAPETAPTPAPVTEPAPEPPPPATLSYKWGSARTYQFRVEVIVTNKGDEPSQNIRVGVPMLENNSPYQKTELQSVNYDVTAANGRISTFNIGDLDPGESKTIVANYRITIRPVSISGTNETVEKARQAYNQFAGSGNCYTLASGFVNRCKEMGLTARVVNGFTRSTRDHMTSGPLDGCRHSWAEFYVDGLGWVPVDLTFRYFANFPYASHIVETYADRSIQVNFSGGSLSVKWTNRVL